jgi:hypothetical protein
MEFHARRHIVEVAADERIATDDAMALCEEVFREMTAEKSSNPRDEICAFL